MTDTFKTIRRALGSRMPRSSDIGVFALVCVTACWMEPLDRNLYGSCERLNEEGVFEDCAPVYDTGVANGLTNLGLEIPDPADVPEAFYGLDTRQVYPEPVTTVVGSVRFGVDEPSGLVVSDVYFDSDQHRVTSVTLRRGEFGGPNSELIRFFERDPSAPDTCHLVDQGLLSEYEVHAWTRGQLFVSVESSTQEILRAQVVPPDVQLVVTDITAKSVSAYHHTPQVGGARAFLTVKETTGDSSIFVHTSGIEPTGVQVRQGAIGDVWGDGPEIHVTYRPDGWSTLWSAPNYALSEDWLFAMQHGRAYVVLYTEDYPSLEGVGALRGLVDLVP